MKFIGLVILFIYASVHVFAEGELYYPTKAISLTNHDEVTVFLKKYFTEFNGDEFQFDLRFKKSTNHSIHSTYTVIYKQLPILILP